ncbi:MAG: RNA 3'-phosphate cyclase [Burkholderiales bacterium]|nr:RNA 3'-phosphate cyclase [Burkholderiales bacterium]
MTFLRIDGAHGEGGGQLVRTAVALAALTGNALRIDQVRAHRDKPGLAAQHLAAVRAVATLCDAKCSGLELRSRCIEFTPGRLRGGEFRFDVGTAGSVTLVLQAVLPVLICAGQHAKVIITGGTDVRRSPPADYFCEVLLPLLARMGAQVGIDVVRRGYYPQGGGQVCVEVSPAPLRALRLSRAGAIESVNARVHVSNLPVQIAERMRDAMLARLAPVVKADISVDTVALGSESAVGAGGAVVAWARTTCTFLGAGRVAERGIRAETLGDSVGAALARDLSSGVTLDSHASDQLLIYLALVGEHSTLMTSRLTSHTRTAMWLIGQFLPVQFQVAQAGGLTRVEVAPQ